MKLCLNLGLTQNDNQQDQNQDIVPEMSEANRRIKSENRMKREAPTSENGSKGHPPVKRRPFAKPPPTRPAPAPAPAQVENDDDIQEIPVKPEPSTSSGMTTQVIAEEAPPDHVEYQEEQFEDQGDYGAYNDEMGYEDDPGTSAGSSGAKGKKI